MKRFSTSGRASRAEFWSFTLFTNLSWLAVAIWMLVPVEALQLLFTGAHVLANFVMIFMWYAVAARRMHDIGHTEWVVLINFIPILGVILFLVLAARAGDARANKYGEAPEPLAA